MKINYKNMIKELNDEIAEGSLKMEDSIQILREDSPLFQDYCVIIDWYYDAFTMKEELDTPLEEAYLPEEFSKEEWQEMLAEREEYKRQYEEDQDKLISMKVKDVITEMKQIQKLFG